MNTGARNIRLGLGVLAFAALTAGIYPIARCRMFTGFTNYDDEGYMLFSLKSFLDHDWHYIGANGYGPFYYEFWGSLFAIFGFDVTHDHGRTMTLLTWMLTSVLIGLVTWRMTSSITLGLLTQLCAFQALLSLTREPMHPGGIIVLLLATVVVFACFVRDRIARLPIALLGATVMALVLIKVNVGVFAFAAVVLVCTATYPALSRIRWLRVVVELGVIVLPLLLIKGKLGEPSVRQFAMHISVAALAVVIALRARDVSHRNSRELWWLGGGFTLVGVAVPLALIASGTSPLAILDGTILMPLRFPTLVTLPLVLPGWTFLIDVLALLGAIIYWYISRRRESRTVAVGWIYLFAAFTFFIGLAMAVSVTAPIPYSPVGLAPLAWLALIRQPGHTGDAAAFACLLLPPLAVLQTLHAYPVAGSQLSWAGLLLLPTWALCSANGIRWALASGGQQNSRLLSIRIGAVTAIIAAIAMMTIQTKHTFDRFRSAHEGSVPLALRGAEAIRVDPKLAADLRATVDAIERNCDTFVERPGMASFYLWTSQMPPTGYDPTSWWVAYDSATQQAVAQTIRRLSRVCLLENESLVKFWTPTASSPIDLGRYLDHDFLPTAKFGDYRLLQRASGH
ncbi:hypothetical protein MycrhDRAFT_5099 [Mycolicibacterium rhodesiae JS60]|nr:hypothetical protein MycrhDRAFT_5099 [Mycolicibacterium rhodesiae JS60]